MKPKKKNPQDSTRRNTQAANKRFSELDRKFQRKCKELLKRIKKLEAWADDH